MSEPVSETNDVRPVIKALGDDTRYQIYNWLRAQESPATIADIAEHFGLHQNTVRPHLDRLRDAGLVRLDASSQGTVGRPQHRYVAVDADLELHSTIESYPVFTQMLASLCCEARATPEQAFCIGRDIGSDIGDRCPGNPTDVLVTQMRRLGFEPLAGDDCVSFENCPLRELAETYPDLICSLHEGLVTGIVETRGGRLSEFHNVARATEPCMALHA